MIGIPLGLLYANGCEWVLHKHVLHRLGRREGSFWRFHWWHHGQARRYRFADPEYDRSVFGWHGQGKEALALVGLGVAHLPLFAVAPFFSAAALYGLVHYYRTHKRAHRDVAWAIRHVPWHFDHHMGPDPSANWCVTRPWFDRLLGTRAPYLGTERAARDGWTLAAGA